MDEEISADAEEVPLPSGYNETRIVLLLRDPLWAFAYWDLDQSDFESISTNAQSHLVLRVYQCDNSGEIARNGGRPFEIPVKNIDRSWYINLPAPGKQYFLDLIAAFGNNETVLCTSNAVASPNIPLNNGANSLSRDNILAVSGLNRVDDFTKKGAIPQRIISLLDTQYLHLQG